MSGGVSIIEDLCARNRYSLVQYIMILHTVLQWQRQSINETVDSQKTPHISPSRASYGVSIERVWVKIDYIITPLHCSSGMDK